jgi:CRP-like cAMP-binding protein
MISQELLQEVYLFKNMTTEECAKFAKIAVQIPMQTGDVLFRAGSPSTAMYLIKDGSISITQQAPSGDTIPVVTLGAGSHFGEMGLVDSPDRSATAEAMEHSALFCFEYEATRALLASDPVIAVKFYRSIAHFLANRLRMSTDTMVFAREKALRHVAEATKLPSN